MPWEKVREVMTDEYEGRPPEQVFASIEEEAFAAASIGQVHRATLRDGSRVAVKVQYPGIADALESDMANAGILVRLAKALAPGLDAKAVAGELRERVLEELDYEYEAQNQRAFARAYDGHPFIYVPKVHSRLSRRRVLVSDYVEGEGFEEVKRLPQDERDIYGEIIFRFCFGSIYHLQHFNADTHPGNYLLMEDGRVAFLDFGMTKRLSPDQIQLEQRAIDAAGRDDAEALREALHDLGFVADPDRVEAERLMEHVKMVGGWYMEDEEVQITPKRVMKMIEVTSDPRSDFFDLVRRESLPADELMGRRMETGLLAVLAQLRATATGTGSCASGSTPIPPRRCSARPSGATSSAAAPRRRPGWPLNSRAGLLGLRSGGGSCGRRLGRWRPPSPPSSPPASPLGSRLALASPASGTRSATANRRGSLLQIPWTPISASSRIRAGSSTVQAISSTSC